MSWIILYGNAAKIFTHPLLRFDLLFLQFYVKITCRMKSILPYNRLYILSVIEILKE